MPRKLKSRPGLHALPPPLVRGAQLSSEKEPGVTSLKGDSVHVGQIAPYHDILPSFLSPRHNFITARPSPGM